MSESVAPRQGTVINSEADPGRWWALGVISLATLMVVLDATRTGLAILPLTVAVIASSGIVTALMRTVPPRIIPSVSFLLCAGAQVWFSRIGPRDAYLRSHAMSATAAVVHGFSSGFLVGAGVRALGAVLTFVLVSATPQEAAGARMASV